MVPELAPLSHLHASSLDLSRIAHRLLLPLVIVDLTTHQLIQHQGVKRRLGGAGRRMRSEARHRVPYQQDFSVEERISRR